MPALLCWWRHLHRILILLAGNRVLLALILRGLAPHISYTMAADDPERASRGGWVFNEPEPVFGMRDLRCVGPSQRSD